MTDSFDAHPFDARRLYGDLAWLWPTLSPPEHYRDEARLYAEILRAHARRPVESILHLGCGGGHIDRWMKREFAIAGLDIAPAMLDLARRLNPEVEYVQGDMRTARLGRTFDAVMLFDSVDYMLSEDELGQAFATAWEHLAPGGVFLTYAETLAETFEDNHTRTTTLEGEGIVLTCVEHAFDPDPADGMVQTLYVYLIRRGAELAVEYDRHLAGCFPKDAWLARLGACGFEAAELAASLWPEGFDDPVTFVGVKPALTPSSR